MRRRNMEKKSLKKRIAAFLMCAAVAMTSVQIPAVTADAAELSDDLTPEEAFVLKDSNFEYGDQYWSTFSMIWEGYTTNATFTPDEEGMTVQIDDVGANGEYAGYWTVALQQDAVLYAGRTYKVSFDLSSSIKRGFTFGMEKKNENKDSVFEEVTGVKEENIGTKQTFTYEYTCTEDMDAKFYINLGAPAKGTSLDPHTIKISNVRMEVEGARDRWVLVDDYKFTDTDAYTLNGGNVTNGYVSMDANGSIAYKDVNVTAGDKYELTFAARTDGAAMVSAMLGTEKIAENEVIEKYTNVYSYTYTATETKTVDLKITASGGKVFLDNIGLWNTAAKSALGLGQAKTELDAGGVAIAAAEDSYPLGTDVELAVTADDFAAWKTAGPQVLVNSKAIAAELYTIADNKIVIKADAFADTGKVSVAVATPGYERISTYVKIIKPDGNLIDNGDFEENFSSWTPYFNERYSGSAEITSDFMVKINISFFLNWYDEWGNDNGPVTWSTQLTHTNIPVKAGKTYKISFLASSTVERPIILEVGAKKYSFKLTPELQEFTAEYDNTWGGDENVKFNFLLGPIAADNGDNKTGIGYTTTDGHTMLFTDISMVDAESTGTDYVKKPSIVGIENGGTYNVPVSAKINYRKEYTMTLTRNGSAIEYTEGDMIKDDGNYVLTVADKADASIKTEKKFNITKDIDYTKGYYAIASKATEKVIEAVGVNDGGAVVQSTFKGRPGQLFTLEEIRQGYIAIRALSSGKVLQVEGASKDNGAKLEQAEYTGANNQLWKIVSVPQGFVKLENKASGKVIDISGAMKTENLQLQQYDNSGSGDEGQNSADGQRFDLIQITDVKQYMENEESPVQTEADWIEKAFITPIAEELNPAGPIAVEWYPIPGAVQSYDIYFDGEKCKTVEATDAETLKTEDSAIYSTEVAEHTMKIVANFAGGKTVETNEIKFFISKKGVGWATLHRTQDMNLSWYYHWALDPALGTDENLTFVPMIWGNYGDDWLADPENQKYGTVLSFNEPDWSDQSNVPVTKELAQAWVDRYNAKNGTNNAAPKSVEESWQAFMDSGLRIGSPATALAPPYCNGTIKMNDVDGPDNWWFDFQDLMDSREDWDYDFTAIHSYNGGCDAEGFLKMVDETYELTGKPIWITEFGVAEWGEGLWNGNDPTTQKKVKEFMIEVINGLEERDFVERYAWFPFNPDDQYGGASGIFNYATGELNELGKTYAMLGLPEGYEGTVYDADITPDRVPAESVTIDSMDEIEKNVKVGDTIQLSVTVAPEGTTDKIKWSSSDESVATVDNNGLVTIKKAGNVTITVKAGDQSESIEFTATGDAEAVPVEGVQISKAVTEMYVGDEMTLSTTVTPANATNKTLTFKSSDESIAVVDAQTGKVSAKKIGTVVITATASNGFSDIISITVKEKPADLSSVVVTGVHAELTTILEGQTTAAVATVAGGSGAVTWKSSNEAAATVDANGVITGVAAGRTTISATCGTSTMGIEIQVVKPTVKWNVSYKTCPLQLKKSTTALKAIGLQQGDSIVSYTSSKKKVATVSSKGKIKAKKVGTTTITVTTKYGAKASIKIKVQKQPVKVTSISVDKTKLTLKKGQSYQLNVTKKYITSLYKVKYTSSNKKVATVSSKGKIKAKKKGKATITVKCQNKTKKVTVTVK